MKDLVSNIELCTGQLQNFYVRNCSQLKGDIARLQKELRDASSGRQQVSWQAVRAIEKKLDRLLDDEEVYWSQRSRGCARWLSV
ncbi:hypothetical protein Q3G72_032705 [Acer saccharum]|nr:hypothetical protein Q3G72_032705 [Acer saccharum]